MYALLMFTWTALTTFIAHLKNFFFTHYLYRYQQFQQEWPISHSFFSIPYASQYFSHPPISCPFSPLLYLLPFSPLPSPDHFLFSLLTIYRYFCPLPYFLLFLSAALSLPSVINCPISNTYSRLPYLSNFLHSPTSSCSSLPYNFHLTHVLRAPNILALFLQALIYHSFLYALRLWRVRT